MYWSSLGIEVKELDFVKVGQWFSTRKPDKGLLIGDSGDSEVSTSSMAKEKRLSDIA